MNEKAKEFFREVPQAFYLYQTLEQKILDRFPDVQTKVQKTQISFVNKHPFVFVWLPIRKIKNRPEVYVIVSFGSSRPIKSPRIEESVEPYPNRWTHHLILQNIKEIDSQLMGWIQEAYDDAQRKKMLYLRSGEEKMKTEKQQLLRNPDLYPSGDVLKSALKEATKAFTQFRTELENHQIELEWRYYHDGKAWLGKGLYKWVGARGGQKTTTVFWLSAWDGFFKVTVYLPEKVYDAALLLVVDVETIEKISKAKSMGKLRSFPIVFEIQSEEQLHGLFSVIEFKKALK